MWTVILSTAWVWVALISNVRTMELVKRLIWWLSYHSCALNSGGAFNVTKYVCMMFLAHMLNVTYHRYRLMLGCLAHLLAKSHVPLYDVEKREQEGQIEVKHISLFKSVNTCSLHNTVDLSVYLFHCQAWLTHANITRQLCGWHWKFIAIFLSAVPDNSIAINWVLITAVLCKV